MLFLWFYNRFQMFLSAWLSINWVSTREYACYTGHLQSHTSSQKLDRSLNSTFLNTSKGITLLAIRQEFMFSNMLTPRLQKLPFLLRSCMHWMLCSPFLRKLFVRLSYVWTLDCDKTKKKFCPDFYTAWKNVYPSFPTRRMAGGGRPLLPEILGQN